jgi:hypothetical protein
MKSTIVFSAILCGFLVSGATIAHGQMAPPRASCTAPLPTIEQLESAGLPALTPEQLAALSQLFDDNARQVMPFSDNAELIESRINGDFDGWEGATLFALENGQVWQQAGPGAKYFFANRPRVRIAGTPARLRVEGLKGEVLVRRVK